MRKSMFKPGILGVAAAALLISACGQNQEGATAQADGEATVLRGFTLINGSGQPPVPDSAMIINGGRISWVGPVAQLQAPDGAETVDLAGKYVMPGLIDLHIHIGNVVDLTQDAKNFTLDSVRKDLATYASYGVTTVFSMGTEGDVVFPFIKEQRASRPETTRLYTAGQGVVFEGGYGGIPNLNQKVDTPEEAVALVDAQAAKGVDAIKLWVDDELGTMPKMPPEISKAVIDAAHRHNLKAYAHIFYLEDAKRLVEQGVDGLVHSVRDQPVDQELIDAMKQRGTVQFAETLSREASMFTFGGNTPIYDDPFFQRSLSPAALALLRSPERQKTLQANPHFNELPKFYETAKANLKRMRDAGVTYGFGTDSGPPGRFPGYFAHWELWSMVEAGLTPMEAITAATGKAAQILGNNEIGTLEPNKWADLVVLDANPVENIQNTKAINAVYVAGNRVWTP